MKPAAKRNSRYCSKPSMLMQATGREVFRIRECLVVVEVVAEVLRGICFYLQGWV